MNRKLVCPSCRRERWVDVSNHIDWEYGTYDCICGNNFTFYNTNKGIMEQSLAL